MSAWKKHWLIEGGFVVALLAVCAVLTALQSRWTRELSHATARQQATQLHSQGQLFCRAFDSQLNEASAQLRPRAEQIESLGREQAHAQCLLRWQAGNPRPLFRRLAVAAPENGGLQLYLLDQKTARLTRADWPREWARLQDNLTQRAAGRPLDIFEDPTGLLREYPVFGSRGGPDRFDRPGPGELEWIIMELDPAYVRQAWLPELARAYLNPGRETLNDVAVKTRAASPETIFATGEVSLANDPVVLAFNNKPRIGPPRGDGRPPRGGGPGDPPDDDIPPDDFPPDEKPPRRAQAESDNAFWTLYVWPRSGEFAATLSNARAHDFALACALDACLLVGGLLVIRYARRARILSDARMQFVAAVSHELRTPLTVIRAAGQSLRRGVVREPARIDKYADLIVEHAERLADMVEQVLAFAGARRNESTLARKPVAVARVVEEAIAECAIDTQAAGCAVETVAEDDLPPVLGDANALRRVFQNLIANAAKHGGRGQWIGVRVRRRVNGGSPGWVEVAVSDRGEGIPPGEQPHVFEPFFRGARAHGQQTRGSGIGLSVVQEIVKVHGGGVRVESRAGEGTSFIVSLPAASPVQAPQG